MAKRKELDDPAVAEGSAKIMKAEPLKCKLTGKAVVINKYLRISFQHTIRVPDSQQTSCLPSNLGKFPLELPGQLWLDGIADTGGIVCQFVAMPFGSEHSIELQVTEKDSTGGIQFEITPCTPKPKRKPYIPKHLVAPLNSRIPRGPSLIHVNTARDERLQLWVHLHETIHTLKERIADMLGTPSDELRLIWSGGQLEDSKTMSRYGISQGFVIHLIFRMRGGGGPTKPDYEMSIAAGGKINQTIVADKNGKEWLSERTTVFNVQILNSAAYKAVTGKNPPGRAPNASTYAKSGFPFFKMYEEPSGIRGNFGGVKSVAEMDHVIEDKTAPKTVHINSKNNEALPSFTNPAGPLRKFRLVHDLEEEYSRYHVASF